MRNFEHETQQIRARFRDVCGVKEQQGLYPFEGQWLPREEILATVRDRAGASGGIAWQLGALLALGGGLSAFLLLVVVAIAY